MAGAQFFHAGFAGGRVVGAAEVPADNATPPGGFREAGERTVPGTVASCYQLLGAVDEGDVPMAEVGEVLDAAADEPAR